MAQSYVRLLDEKTVVYSHTDVSSPPAAALRAGDEVSIGKILKVAGVKWCPVTLSNGKIGYMAGSTRVFRRRDYTLNQNTVDVLEAPADGSNVKSTYTVGNILTVVGREQQGKWFEVRTASGDIGFIPVETKVKEALDPKVANRLAIGCGSVILLIVLAVMGLALTDYINDQSSDELAKGGGRNRVYDWLAKDGLLDNVRQNTMTFTQCVRRADGRSYPFVVWVFGQDYSDYSDTRIGSGVLGPEVGTATWGHTNTVLMVKLTSAGTETRRIAQASTNNPSPGVGSYKNEEIKVYNAEAWLVDKQTRQCLGHMTFQPGPDPDSGYSQNPGFIFNPFVRVYSVKSLRFRAVGSAVEWAKSLQ